MVCGSNKDYNYSTIQKSEFHGSQICLHSIAGRCAVVKNQGTAWHRVVQLQTGLAHTSLNIFQLWTGSPTLRPILFRLTALQRKSCLFTAIVVHIRAARSRAISSSRRCQIVHGAQNLAQPVEASSSSCRFNLRTLYATWCRRCCS